MLTLRRWLERIFAAIGDAAMEGQRRREAADRLARIRAWIVESARREVRALDPAESPVWAFARRLSFHEKPRARFDQSTSKWSIPVSEQIRVVKLYQAAGYPGLNGAAHD